MRAHSLAERVPRLLLITFVIGAVVSYTIPARAQEPDPLTVGEAASIAQDHVLREQETIPDWEGALLSAPKIHYDLNGQVAAYVFSLLSEGSDVGCITVSGQRLPNPVLEFSTALARYRFTRAAIRSAADRMGLAIDAHRPIVGLVNDHDVCGNHFITGFGCEFDPEDAGYRYMIVHDTWGSTPENYWVQYDAGYDRIWFDTVVPPSLQVDTTPPSSAVNRPPPYQISETFDVTWSGSDQGWGIKWYDVQYKDGSAGEWTDWITHSAATQGSFAGVRRHTYYFRSRAMDIDHNQQPYPSGDGDTHATVAQVVASGHVRGNRGRAVIAAEVTASPTALGTALTDPDGLYQLGLGAAGTYSLTAVGNASFGPLPPMKGVELTGDTDNLGFILPPVVELVTHGGFELGFEGWSTGGIVTPMLTTTAHTGSYAVSLGEDPLREGSSIISQTISDPPTIEQPTLSLMFEAAAADPGFDRSALALTAPTSTVTHALPLTGTGWQHAWYDVSELAGGSLEVALELYQDSADTPTTVFLDEVSVGPWVHPLRDGGFTSQPPRHHGLHPTLTHAPGERSNVPTCQPSNIPLFTFGLPTCNPHPHRVRSKGAP